MRKILSTVLVALAFMGSAAQAYEGTLAIDKNGVVKIQPLQDNCDDMPRPSVSSDMEVQYACNPGTAQCPKGYHPAPKYCWGGWHKGFYRCGTACQINNHCADGRYYNPECGNPGGGRGPN